MCGFLVCVNGCIGSICVCVYGNRKETKSDGDTHMEGGTKRGTEDIDYKNSNPMIIESVSW